MLEITLKREEVIDTKLKDVEAMVFRAESVAGHGEGRLKKRGETERLATKSSLDYLKEALDMIDEKVSKALESMQDIETRAKEHVQPCTDLKNDVMCM